MGFISKSHIIAFTRGYLLLIVHCTKVSLSSPDPILEDDFSVAANFNDNQLSVCKPCRDDSTWTHIEIPHSGSFDLMYTKRDETFYFTACEGLFNLTNNNELKYKALRLRNEPQMSNPDSSDMLEKCHKTEHLVESPSGELFFIKWYTKSHYVHEVCGSYKIRHIRPQRFMVFREKEKRSNDFCYTEDIGDLCIFLGKIGLYDLASGTIRSFRPCDDTKFSDARYWLHPTNPKGTENGTYVASCSGIDDSYLHRFQSIRALSVQDLIKPERCEEIRDEFRLLGERKVTKAVELGQGREEVVEKVMIKSMQRKEEGVVEKVKKKFNKLEELEKEVVEIVTKCSAAGASSKKSSCRHPDLAPRPDRFPTYSLIAQIQLPYLLSSSFRLPPRHSEKVAKKVRGNKELEEEVVENITRTFSKLEELEEEIAEKVTKKFRGNKELDEEVVEKIKKIFSEMEITEEVVEKVTKKFSKLKKREVEYRHNEQEITEEVAEKVTKVFLSTPDDDDLDDFFYRLEKNPDLY
ncbi:unnamed protein product [Arabis nemorensis]|uniref:KIB1-4 beta-propeller domain-containing protein n=1 Tax=Arabis nemorensis TaxID=586526 RepID=A0A565CAH2_9BRAS|nr:unnamed protein product [Arabis nemorensis]